MAANTSLDISSAAGKPRLRKSLKLWQVVMMGLAYLTPMTVFDTFGIVSGISNGHVPASYLLALAGVLFTAISYGKLVRQFPEAGSAYTYAQKSISPHVGFMVGWSSLLDYLFLPMINVLLAKIYLSALFPEVPPWVWVVGFVAILTAANIKSVNLVANFNTLFVLVQIAIMVVFIFLVVQGLHKGEGVGTVWSLQPFISQNAHLIPIITGATIVCFSFLGFDAVTTLSEETPDAARTIPKAIFLTAVYGGIIFIVASFFMQLFFPISAALRIRMRRCRKLRCTSAGNCSSRFSSVPPSSTRWRRGWRRTPASPACCMSWGAITSFRSVFLAMSIRNGGPRPSTC